MWAQSTAGLRGTVVDPQGSVVPDAAVTLRNSQTGVENPSHTDSLGIFEYPTLPPGSYHIEISHPGFQKLSVDGLLLAVDSVVAQKFTLTVGTVSQVVTVTAEPPTIETTTATVGQVIDRKTVQEIPLNGRHFVDLGLLIPGTVTPPQNGFLTAPLRGQGSFAFNTAGNREDTTNFMVNGINLNDMVNNQITFQPSINTVAEFKVDNSTFSAEYGRNSGSIVNIATRSGTNEFHGEAFEYIRNNAFDARNLFNYATITTGVPNPQAPFKRNNFGAAFGGPVRKNKTFFFLSYEGLRQRQGITINSGVLSDSTFPRTVGTSQVDERAKAAATGNPAVVKLLPLIPSPNAFDSKQNPVFLGGATAPVSINQGTADLGHNIGTNDHLHGYYVFQRDLRQEPTLAFNTIPGFGDTRQSHRQILTLSETHIFSFTVVNEARIGFNRIHITFVPNAALNPTDFSINDGINAPIGLPQINIPNIGLNFGGPSLEPNGRGDTTGVLSDTLSWLHGRHSFKVGGEVRRFYNNNFGADTGSMQFNTLDNFIKGNVDLFSITLGNNADKIAVGALGVFMEDTFHWKPNFTWEVGFRYDWNMTPTEAHNQFAVYQQTTNSLVQVGANGLNSIYYNNNKNFEPRIGFSWDPFGSGKTSVRAAYAILSDQPITNFVVNLAGNPPFAIPVTVNAVTFSTAGASASGRPLNQIPIAISSADPNFHNAYVQDWNLNIQRDLPGGTGLMVGYFGSKGTHLRIARNINQPIAGANPITTLSATSPIDPGGKVSTIAEVDSGSNSSYHALWVTANKRLTHGLQFNASYTYSHSIDYNSLTSANGVVVEDSTNFRNDRGSSDFDARHRFVINWLYELPFRGNRFKEGWQLAAITQVQSGNPLNLVIASSAFTGFRNTVRPDVIGPITYNRSVGNWFNALVCDLQVTPAGCSAGSVLQVPDNAAGTITHFGNLGRNVLIGPRFVNSDFTVQKTTRITEVLRVQFRAEMFDLFNHPNLGQPGRIVAANSSSLGVITNTRFPTGDSGSARQIQFALKLLF
jgi:hypothetical protein